MNAFGAPTSVPNNFMASGTSILDPMEAACTYVTYQIQIIAYKRIAYKTFQLFGSKQRVHQEITLDTFTPKLTVVARVVSL